MDLTLTGFALCKVLPYSEDEPIIIHLRQPAFAAFIRNFPDFTTFVSNAFLNDKFLFKSMNYYPEDDFKICKSGLNYYLNNYEIPKIINKKHGIFEKFFNYFSR